MLCPMKALGRTCDDDFSFVDNFESNVFAMILLGYDLLREPIQQKRMIETRSIQAGIIIQ